MSVQPIPEGYHTVTPYLIVNGAARLLDFVKRAFDAQETTCMKDSAGKIRHAEVKIGDSHLMIADAAEQWPAMPTCIYLYVDDVDAMYDRAIKAGATSLNEPTDQFYGDRNGSVQDAVGNKWFISTHVEDVPPAEMARRAQAQMA